MPRTLYSIFIISLAFCSSVQAAQEILLRLQPAAESPVIAKITASDKVILDAAPAPTNAGLGWRQLALPTPFEGYVPVATLKKSLRILEGTPVQYLPTANSAQITQVEAEDSYEVVRVSAEWATVRFQKNITGYFNSDSSQGVRNDFNAIQVPQQAPSGATKPVVEPTPLPRPLVEPTPLPQPVAIPAARTRINPDQPIGNLDPNALPKENVVWQAAHARLRGRDSIPEPAPHAAVPKGVGGIMVPPAQTQAREASPELGPTKTPRLLTGTLVREIQVSGPGYPIRLKSPEGRFIAYVDFSGIYISDLTPYLEQKVYLRGQIHPVPSTPSQLVILAESLRLAE